MKVAGTGVLIEGMPGIGKSALALELLSRGHRLIADDAIEINTSEKKLIGHCPPLLADYLEVRGLGILDVRRHFGARSVLRQSTIDLVIALDPRASAGNRLTGNRRTRRLLGIALPRITLQPGHNLAVLIEAACHAESLRLKGFDAAATLTRRQQQAILKKRP